MSFNDPRYQPRQWGFAALPSDTILVGDPFGWPRDLDESANDSLTPEPGQTADPDTPGLSPPNAALLRFVGLDSVNGPALRLVDDLREPSGGVQRSPVGAGKLSTDNTPVPFLDVHGNPVLIGKDGPIMIPRGVDPAFFVNRGLADRSKGALSVLDGLWNFRQGGAWDLQRQNPDSTVDRKFIDAATIALGLYGSAAGIDPDELLRTQSYYARIFSNFKNAPTNPTYHPLPQTNVQNTHLGYDLHRSGRIGLPPTGP